MAALVTLAVAKTHLRITDALSDADVLLKVEQASDIIVERCNSTAWWRAITPTWTDSTVPLPVQAAILLMLTHLYENRGDDMKADEALWAAINRQISMNKDPVIA